VQYSPIAYRDAITENGDMAIRAGLPRNFYAHATRQPARARQKQTGEVLLPRPRRSKCFAIGFDGLF
jgi:hypothetical protein